MITYVIPTTGRPSLREALDSIECWPGDEILVVGSLGDVVDPRVKFLPMAMGGDWGHTERNYAKPFARGRYLVNLDDDDTLAPGSRSMIEAGIEQAKGRPIIFRMQYPNGFTLWIDHQIVSGNVGTPMMVFPNDREKLGHWGNCYTGDFEFLRTCKWAPDDYVWNESVLALIGHDVEPVAEAVTEATV